MKRLALIAIGPAETMPAPPPGCLRVVERGLAAILWREGSGLSAHLDRKRFGRALVGFQRLLEALQGSGPLLAAAPGALVATEAEARAMLAANAASLEAALDAWGAIRQHQVTISWDLGAALGRFASAAEIVEARRGVDPKDRLALGRALQAGMEAVRARLAAQYAAILAPHALDSVQLPGDETTVLNTTLGVGPGGEAALERAVEAIDATWPEGLKIKLIGPLPALSFAAIHLDRPKPEDIRAARARLGLVEGASLEEIRDAFRARARAAHPDLGGDAADADATIAARDLLVRVAAAQTALGRAGPAPLVAIRREGDVEAAA